KFQSASDCPTPCRSAASPPHERFVDVTPMSQRRDRRATPCSAATLNRSQPLDSKARCIVVQETSNLLGFLDRCPTVEIDHNALIRAQSDFLIRFDKNPDRRLMVAVSITFFDGCGEVFLHACFLLD